MSSFTIYAKNGRIIKTVNTPLDMLDYQVQDSESVILGDYEDTNYYIDTAGVHKPVLMPPRPDENHIFEYGSRQWVDPRTLKQLKDAKWESIKQKRNETELDVFEYNGMVFDGDLDAQRRLATYVSISSKNPSFEAMFILANNDRVLLTAADFIAIEAVKVMQVSQAFDKAATLREQIYAANTQDELENLVW